MAALRVMPASGNRVIDGQHLRLSELIHVAADEARAGGEAFVQAVRAFCDALAEHFSVEGVIFRGAGYDASEEHDAAHAAILNRVQALAENLPAAASAPERHQVVDELEHILFDHELLEDSAYWESVRRGGDGPAVVWDPELELGIDWIDDQHRHLAAIINDLSEASRAADKNGMADLTHRFFRHARQHFAAEERHLDSLGKHVSPHRAEHLRLLDDLTAMLGQAEPGALSDHYLRFWIFDHIRGADFEDFGRKG